MSQQHTSASRPLPPSAQGRRHSFFDELLCTFFMAGHFPYGPGTAGAFVATILWSVAAWAGVPFLTLQLATLLLILLVTLVSIPSIRRLEADWGEDPSKVVVDEAVGVWIALLAVPPTFHWAYVLGAFLLFRLFDIVKPFGIRRMEAVRGGWGVMLDDIVAGLYSAVVLIVCRLVQVWLA